MFDILENPVPHQLFTDRLRSTRGGNIFSLSVSSHLGGGGYPIPGLGGVPHPMSRQGEAVADPGFGQGGGQKFFPRICRRSEAESGERSEPILAGVQGLP